MLLTFGIAPYSIPGSHREGELKKAIVLIISMVFLAGCAVNRYRSDFEFANKLAQEGLWKEAYYRLQKVKTKGGDSAQLHNNLAVILEGLNRLSEAEQEYQLAMKLDPANTLIKDNYDRFKKKEQKKEKKEKPEEGKNEK